jgi:hypothetical protein
VRVTAIFTRDEVRQILCSPDVPTDRRVFYAVMFLGGLRFGEIAALKVRHYRPELEPLGQLQVASSYHSKRKELKGVKTDRPRLVPVHPWLARILGEWLAVGCQALMGRPPGPEDILIPTRQGQHRSSSTMWRQLNGTKAKKRVSRARQGGRQVTCRKCSKPGHTARWCGRESLDFVLGDLQRLGLRSRRQHDARRTFITFCLEDGARKDILRWVSHGPEGDIVDLYTTLTWPALCAEVAKLELDPLPPAPLLDGRAAPVRAGAVKVATKVATVETVNNIRHFECDPSGIRKPSRLCEPR